jgi:hypothetical protein
MGTTGKWSCLDCGHEFKASAGGGFYFSLYRCVKCDRTKSIEVELLRPTEWIIKGPKGVGQCRWCGGELRNDINPMCRKCKNRNTKEIEIEVFYD